MNKLLLIFVLVLMGAGVIITASVMMRAPSVSTIEIDERPILATELPGTIEDNAAKAYRMLIWDLAREADEPEPYTHKTTSAIKLNPTQFFGSVDRVVEISKIDRIDWGIEQSIGSLVPHVSEMGALDALVAAKIDALIESGDGEAIGELLASRVRMAQQLSEGWSLIEWVSAEKYMLLKALDQVEANFDLILASDTGRAALLASLEPISIDNPLGVKDAVRADMSISAEGLRGGYFANENIMIGSSDAPKLKGRRARRVATLVDELRSDIMQAWDLSQPSDLITARLAKFDDDASGFGWVVSNYADIHDRASALAERIETVRALLTPTGE